MSKLNVSKSVLVLLAGLISFVFFFLLFRNTGLYPSVFADEYLYSKFSRLVPLAESSIPGYIYLWLYGLTSYCGDGFLGCARLINTLLFVAATPFIFLTAKRVTTNQLSLLVAGIAIISPINVYTAFFMPESFYFLVFWVFVWYFLDLTTESDRSKWLIAGMIYGFSALVKPHSLLLLPAVVMYVGVLFFLSSRLVLKDILRVLGVFLTGGCLIKFGFGYLLAGSAGLTLFGPLYGDIAASTASQADELIRFFQLAYVSFSGHSLALAAMYGLPIVIAVALVLERVFAWNKTAGTLGSTAGQFQNFTFFTFFFIANLIFAVAFFTGSVTQDGPYESPYRLHMRYYNFAFPLLYIVAAGALSLKVETKRYVRYSIGFVVTLLGFYALWVNLSPYTPGLIDSPAIRGLQFNPIYFQICGGLLILALAIWALSQRRGLQIYLYVALPFYVIVSTSYASLELRERLDVDTYDIAGIFAEQYLLEDQADNVVVAGSDESSLYRALFHLDNPYASIDVIDRDAAYDIRTAKVGSEWVLLIGNHDLLGAPSYQIQLNGFSLIRVSDEDVIDFRRAVWPGVLSSVRGLSTPEDWGAWSRSDVVELEFLEPLPSEFEVLLTARAFGPNTQDQFEVSVGESLSTFTLPASLEHRVLRFNNPTESNVLSIKIPRPVSPSALGLGGDTRELGIGIASMRIVPLD